MPNTPLLRRHAKRGYSPQAYRFTKAFIDEFCDSSGAIDWTKLVEFNSGNLGFKKARVEEEHGQQGELL